MLRLLLSNYTRDIKKDHSINQSTMDNMANKQFADSYAEAYMKMQQESDPIKQAKMNARLALGVTDFSDL